MLKKLYAKLFTTSTDGILSAHRKTLKKLRKHASNLSKASWEADTRATEHASKSVALYGAAAKATRIADKLDSALDGAA